MQLLTNIKLYLLKFSASKRQLIIQIESTKANATKMDFENVSADKVFSKVKFQATRTAVYDTFKAKIFEVFQYLQTAVNSEINVFMVRNR